MKNAGEIIIFGSGATTASGINLLYKYFSTKEKKQKIIVLETPAGF